jgi:hypothetical protein
MIIAVGNLGKDLYPKSTFEYLLSIFNESSVALETLRDLLTELKS